MSEREKIATSRAYLEKHVSTEDGRVGYKATFTVGTQSFSISGNMFRFDEEAEAHCRFIVEMFNLALEKVIEANKA